MGAGRVLPLLALFEARDSGIVDLVDLVLDGGVVVLHTSHPYRFFLLLPHLNFIEVLDFEGHFQRLFVRGRARFLAEVTH